MHKILFSKKDERLKKRIKMLAMGFEPMRTYVQKILSLPP
jgi:hypothetical protein